MSAAFIVLSEFRSQRRPVMAFRHGRTWVLSALIAAGVAVAGVVWSGRGSGPPQAAGEVVAAERGEVAVTVGGIGHVNSRPTSSATAANTPRRSVARATSVATHRRAACSSSNRTSSRSPACFPSTAQCGVWSERPRASSKQEAKASPRLTMRRDTRVAARRSRACRPSTWSRPARRVRRGGAGAPVVIAARRTVSTRSPSLARRSGKASSRVARRAAEPAPVLHPPGPLALIRGSDSRAMRMNSRIAGARLRRRQTSTVSAAGMSVIGT